MGHKEESMEKKDMESKDTEEKEYGTPTKVIKTIFVMLTFVIIGLFAELPGPTKKDLIIKTDSNYAHMARAISGRGFGFFIGAVLSGPIIGKFGRYMDLVIALCLDAAAAITFAIPYIEDVNVLWVNIVIISVFECLKNIIGQKIVLALWKDKAIAPLHLVYFGYGVGAAIIPFISNPYVAVEGSKSVNFNLTLPSENSTMPIFLNGTKNIKYYEKETEVEKAYMIVAICIAALSVFFYILQFTCPVTPPEAPENSKLSKEESKCKHALDTIDPKTCANGDRSFGIQVFVLLFFYFFFTIGAEKSVGKFIRTYAIDKHKFSVEDGSLLSTLFWTSYSIGRLLGLVASILAPIRILIVVEVFLVLIIGILMEVFAIDNSLALWILSVLFGLLLAPLFPSGISWGNFFLELTGTATTFVFLAGACGIVSNLWVVGSLYQSHSYDMFIHKILFFAGCTMLITTLMTLVSFGRKGRFVNEIEINTDTNIDKLKGIDNLDFDRSNEDDYLPPKYHDIVCHKCNAKIVYTIDVKNLTDDKVSTKL